MFPCCFYFNDTATTEIYTLSLHDALPISSSYSTIDGTAYIRTFPLVCAVSSGSPATGTRARSEEHTSELQSQFHLVCRLLLVKKKPIKIISRNLKIENRKKIIQSDACILF